MKCNAILMDYYEGAFGPTIRINICSLETLVQVRNIFLQLAEARVREVKLHKVESVKVTNVKGLTLRLIDGNRERTMKTLELEDNTPEGPVFYWFKSSLGWIECAELIEGLIERNAPGHQYLTDEGIDDAIVEIAFLET